MRRSTLVPVLLAMALVAASGCLGVGGPTDGTDDGTPTPAIESGMNDSAITDAVLGATEDVERYSFSVDSNTSGSGFGNTASTMTGTVDRPAKRVQAGFQSQFDGESQQSSAILAGETVYSREENGSWRQFESSDEMAVSWAQFDYLSKFVELFDRSDATVVGSETVDGRAMTILEADVDPETYVRVMSGENATGSAGEANVTVSLRMAVENETAYPREITTKTTTTGSYSSETTTVVTIEEYGVDTDIATPAAATPVTPGFGSASDSETVVDGGTARTIELQETDD